MNIIGESRRPVPDYQSLIEVVRARVDELQISHGTLDELVGWADGLAGKVLGDAQIKALSIGYIWTVLEALGLRLVVEDDMEALERMRQRGRYKRRHDRYRHPHHTYRGISAGARKRLMRELGHAGGRARISKIAPETREKIARKAGIASGRARRRAKRLARGHVMVT